MKRTRCEGVGFLTKDQDTGHHINAVRGTLLCCAAMDSVGATDHSRLRLYGIGRKDQNTVFMPQSVLQLESVHLGQVDQLASFKLQQAQCFRR